MTSSAPPPEAAGQAQLVRMLAAAGITGYESVLCFGSYLSPHFDAGSDIDVLVVTDRHTLQKRLLRVEGRALDLTECTFDTLLALLQKKISRETWLEILATGRIVADE